MIRVRPRRKRRPFLNPSKRPPEAERPRRLSLRAYSDAQFEFQKRDLDRNGRLDFWTADIAGLGAALPKAMAAADAATRSPAGSLWPKDGYLLRALTTDRSGNPYGQDSDGSGRLVHNFASFGAAAYPADYGASGRHTFIINQEGYIFRRDTGGMPVTRFPTVDEMNELWEAM